VVRKTTTFCLVTLFLGYATLFSGCVSAGLPDEATPAHRYYAALADYNGAKRTALEYAKLPSTPDEHVETILAVVEATDSQLKAFEALRRDGAVGSSNYALIATVLQQATEELLKRAVLNEAGLTPATALLLLRLIGVLGAGIRLVPQLRQRRDELTARIEQMIREDRDPTNEEIDVLLSESDWLTNEIAAEAERRQDT